MVAISNNLVNLPVCPPTPTHHSRKPRTPELRPPNLKSTDPPDFPVNGTEVHPAPESRNLDVVDGHCSSSSNSLEREHLRINLIAMSELRNLNKDLAR